MLEIDTIYSIDCHKFMTFVKKHYNRDIDVIAIYAPDFGNHSAIHFDVDKEEPDDWYPEEEDIAESPEDAMQKWLSDEEDYRFLDDELGINPGLILWDLCKKDLIPEGKYILDVWW